MVIRTLVFVVGSLILFIYSWVNMQHSGCVLVFKSVIFNNKIGVLCFSEYCILIFNDGWIYLFPVDILPDISLLLLWMKNNIINFPFVFSTSILTFTLIWFKFIRKIVLSQHLPLHHFLTILRVKTYVLFCVSVSSLSSLIRLMVSTLMKSSRL